jgi:hypothetical protein
LENTGRLQQEEEEEEEVAAEIEGRTEGVLLAGYLRYVYVFFVSYLFFYLALGVSLVAQASSPVVVDFLRYVIAQRIP